MDETQPLLPSEPKDAILTGDEIVNFDPNGDNDNPRDWAAAYRWSMATLLAFNAFSTTFTCIGVVPIANQIVNDLDNGVPSKSASVLLVTIWELGEAAGPLLIAPLSEVVGRYPVLNGANLLFVVATVLAATASSTNVLIAARFLTGLAVASNVLNPAIVGDMFAPEQRGTAMSFLILAPLIGGAIGPTISGALTQAVGWRAVLWLCAVLAALSEVAFALYFKETFVITILERRAIRLRAATGNERLRSALGNAAGKGESTIITSILRPFVVFGSSSVLQIICVYGSISFVFFYVMSTSLPDILQDIYGLSPVATGFCFLAFSFGSILSTIICNLSLDRIYVRLRDRNKGAAETTVGKPEYRLPLAIIGAFAMPIMIGLYGWVAQVAVPLPWMLIVTFFLGLGLMMGFLPVISYIVDAFGLYSASALTACIVLRCLAGTFLPLLTVPLVSNLGWGWGFTVFAAISLALAPIPVLVMRYGQAWRQRSTYSKDDPTL